MYKPFPTNRVMITDAEEMFGDCRLLLRILNRLGCTSSPDTHDHFVTQHAEAQCKQGNLQFLNQAHSRRPRAWFLKIVFVRVFVCVCVPAPEDINNQWRDMV